MAPLFFFILYFGYFKQDKKIRVMHSVSGHLLNIPKKEIKRKFNIEKVTFYISKVLNAHISRQNFYFNMLNHCSGHYLAFSKKLLCDFKQLFFSRFFRVCRFRNIIEFSSNVICTYFILIRHLEFGCNIKSS
jgi:hypothetical protein